MTAQTQTVEAAEQRVAMLGLAEWHLKTSELWRTGDERCTFHVTASLTIHAAITAELTGAQPAPVPVAVGEANQQGLYFIKGWDACRVYEGLPCNVDSDDAMRQRMPAPSEQGDAKDASPEQNSFHLDSGASCGVQIVWPKERRVGRREDMSPDGVLIVGLDNDNDVYIEVSGDRHGEWQSACVEFCNGGGGGGQSSRTRAALINLMTAIEADNAELPHKAFPGAAILAKPGEPT